MDINSRQAYLAQDERYQKAFKKMPPDAKAGWCPPCPRCAGVMIGVDVWLVTIAYCTECDWSMSEGTGCLI